MYVGNTVNNNRCYWPSFQHNKVVAAIRKNDPDIHWPSYGITLFRNSTYDDYKTREKCKKAESTSDLNSEMSGEEKKRRKIRKRQFSSSEEEADDECTYNFLPTPPSLKDNYGQEIRENTTDQEVAITQDDARNNTFTKTSCSGESFQHSSSLKNPEHIKAIDKQVAAQQDNNFETNFVNSRKENFPFNPNSKCMCQLCPAHVQMQNKNEIYFKEIIRQQNYFKAQLWQTSEDIREIKNVGLNQTSGINDSIQRQESVFCSFTLPLETEEELQEVEQFLKN